MRYQVILSVLCLTLHLAAPLSAKEWSLVKEESEVTATGMLNKKERVIEFTDFDAVIVFDKDNLADSGVTISFDVTKINDPLDFTGDAVATMMHSSWFDGENIQDATFSSQEITSVGDDQYEAIGTLTIKNIEQPLTVPFTFESFDGTTAVAVTEGVKINRTDFKLGDGWNFPGYTVGDEVLVRFNLKAQETAAAP